MDENRLSHKTKGGVYDLGAQKRMDVFWKIVFMELMRGTV